MSRENGSYHYTPRVVKSQRLSGYDLIPESVQMFLNSKFLQIAEEFFYRIMSGRVVVDG
jgi:hypothetical protein